MKYEFMSERRKSIEMTQIELSKKIGVTQSMICNIESGRRRPSPELAQKIGAILGFDWTVFFTTDKSDNVDAFENKQE